MTLFRLLGCSRWEELKQTIKFQAGLAEAGCFPTEYRLLNSNGRESEGSFLLGTGEDGGMGYNKLMEKLEEKPDGETPLCAHLGEIIDEIRKFETFLNKTGKRAVIIIATDGEPSDGDLGVALTALQVGTLWVVTVYVLMHLKLDPVCVGSRSPMHKWREGSQLLEFLR